MNMEGIETFLMIVKTKNLTKTADNLFLSQPTVSHRLKVLEEEVQMQLLHRKKGLKTIELTSKGKEFVPLAERWISLWKELQLLQRESEHHYLTIGSTDTLNLTILKDFYSHLRLQEENIYLNLRTHQSQEIYDLIDRYDLDVGFVYHRLNSKNLVARPILSEELYVLDSHPEAPVKEALTLGELDRDRELFFSWDNYFEIWHNEWLGSSLHPRLQIDTYGMLIHFLRERNLWTIAPRSIVDTLQEHCSIRAYKLVAKVPPPPRTTFLVRHKHPNLATLKAVDLFEELLTKYIETHEKSV